MDWNSFWMFFWIVIEVFVFVAYLMVMFNILGDLFRDRSLGGLGKALWVVALIALPVLSALIYLVARGKGMEQRRHDSMIAAQKAMDDYIRLTAHTSNPARTIADASQLLGEGTITQQEFDVIKAKALA